MVEQHTDTIAHYLITRLSAGLSSQFSKDDAKKWMKYRMKIFNDIWAPSIDAQTNQDFHLVFICDPQYSPFDIDGLILSSHFSFEYWGKPLREWIRAHATDEYDADRIITTRLDSDDAVYTTFIEQIQDAAKQVPLGERGLISFPKYQVYNMLDDTTMVKHNVSNTFISLVEPNTPNLRTVYHDNHRFMVNHYEHVVKLDDIAGLMIVHEHNKLNDFSGEPGQPDWSKYGIRRE